MRTLIDNDWAKGISKERKARNGIATKHSSQFSIIISILVGK
jgi:hypothetical protein